VKNFLFFSREELVEALKALERAELTGATSFSYQGGMAVAMNSPSQIANLKRKILKRLEEIDGKSYGSGQSIRTVDPIIDSGYGVQYSRRVPLGFRFR
jgi:hypothetical protein